MEVKITNFQLLKGISFPTSTSWDIYVWILVMFVGGDQFLELFLDLQFLLCILIRNLPICTKNWQIYFSNSSRSIFLKRCYTKMLLWPQGSAMCTAIFYHHNNMPFLTKTFCHYQYCTTKTFCHQRHCTTRLFQLWQSTIKTFCNILWWLWSLWCWC